MADATQPPSSTESSPEVLGGRTYRMMRRTHGVGLRELARLVNVSPGHLSRVEKGERNAGPSLDQRIQSVFAALPKKAS